VFAPTTGQRGAGLLFSGEENRMGRRYNQTSDQLRRRAEAGLASENEALSDLSPDDCLAMIHELRTHQIELEMQNEALRKAEIELTDAREQYANLYNFSPVGYISLSPGLMIERANLAIARMLGVEACCLLHKPFSKFVFEEDQDIYYLHHRKLVGSGLQKVAQLWLMRADGSTFWARLETMAAHDLNMDAESLLMAVSDISLQKDAEQMLQQDVDQYRAVFESMPDIYYKTDLEGRFQLLSPSCLRSTGYRPEELIGRLATDFYADPVQRRALMEQLRQHGEVNDFELLMVHKDGSGRFASISSRLILDKHRQPIAIEGIVRDISARKHAEAKLLESQSNHAEAQKIAQLGHWTLDLVKDELLWSDENYRIFGQEPGVPNTYETFLEIVHPDDYEFVNEAYLNSVKHRCVYDIEHRLLLPDGTIKWVNERCKTTYAADGTPLKSIGTTLDITKRKQAEIIRDGLLQDNRSLMRQLMQVQEEERRLLARDLHDELGQLLTGTEARAEFIARHTKKAALRTAAQDIIRDIRIMFDASHDTLFRLRPATLDTLGLAAALTELIDQWNQCEGIDCILQIDGPLEPLDELHAIAIYRLVQEGLTNALRHGKADHIMVDVNCQSPHDGDAGRVRVEIVDNGKGLVEQDKSDGLGIIGMRERVHALGGVFSMTHIVGGGVRIEAVLPLDDEGLL